MSIEKLAELLKGRKVSLDPSITTGALLEVIASKTVSYVRGLIKLRRSIFCGPAVKVRNKRLLTTGTGVEIGAYTNINCLGKDGLQIGHGSKIGRWCLIEVSGTLSSLGSGIKIGNDVGIGDFAHIGGAGGVAIGSDTITGAYLSIHPENHNFDNPDTLIRLQGVSRKGVTIGKNCWIGAKVTFLDGASVGDGCVIGAGAVVTKRFGPNQILAGVPARSIGERQAPNFIRTPL